MAQTSVSTESTSQHSAVASGAAKAHLSELESRHRELDQQISSLGPAFWDEAQGAKRKKLRLKERITSFKKQIGL